MNWKRAVIAAMAAVPVILLLAWGFTRDPDAIPSPLPGHVAPVFALPVFAPGDQQSRPAIGDTIRLADLHGQIVVLNFWASWCGPCRAEHAALSSGARRYAGRQVRFLGVLYLDTVTAARDWIAEMGGASYPSLVDHETRTAIDYGISGVPETFFIDGEGRVTYKEIGPVTDSSLSKVIDAMLAGIPTPTLKRER